jgi:uracil permease
LGSSFAFLAPAFIVIDKMGYEYVLGGFIVAGAIFSIVAIIIKFAGVNWIDAVLPPAAMGPIVALIGLELAGSAASTGGIISVDGAGIDPKLVIVFVFTLVSAIMCIVAWLGIRGLVIQ